MREFLTVITELIFIACVQFIIDITTDKAENNFMYRIFNIACCIGSLYILINYAYNGLIKEMLYVFKITF